MLYDAGCHRSGGSDLWESTLRNTAFRERRASHSLRTMDPADNRRSANGARREWHLPDACTASVQQLFAESGAVRWRLSIESFQAVLCRSAAKRFAESPESVARIQEYLAALHVADLALAAACAEGSEAAWNHFVAEYRGYLRAAAAAILRRSVTDPAAIELADSLFADFYGLSGGKAGGRSLFRYFHGRSSLKTWLRAVLAQRNIDALRAGRKFNSLDDGGDDGEKRRVPEISIINAPADPHRELYLQRFREALSLSLASLEPRDRSRLHLYYVEEHTLAEIGRELGEHESSVSRNLERIRKELRETVEGLLRTGKAASNGGPASPGMDDAQIELCIQYAGEDAAIDLDKLFESRSAENRPHRQQGPNRILEP